LKSFRKKRRDAEKHITARARVIKVSKKKEKKLQYTMLQYTMYTML